MSDGMTVKQAIEILQRLDPDAYLFADNDGIRLEVVDILGGYKSEINGKVVDAVHLIFKGDAEALRRMRAAMSDIVKPRDS